MVVADGRGAGQMSNGRPAEVRRTSSRPISGPRDVPVPAKIELCHKPRGGRSTAADSPTIRAVTGLFAINDNVVTATELELRVDAASPKSCCRFHREMMPS